MIVPFERNHLRHKKYHVNIIFTVDITAMFTYTGYINNERNGTVEIVNNTQLATGYTACEEYRNHIIAIKDGHYRSFRGYGALARTRPCSTREECRRMVDKYITDEIEYHNATNN